MKKLTLSILTVFMSMTFQPMIGVAAEKESIAISSETKEKEAAEAEVLLNRLNEIKAMDKSNLSSMERKELRSEVKVTKERLKDIGGGVYLSVGAIIVILLVLIILL